MEFSVTYAGAFLAGLVSFFSPCVLPLVPPYLCYIGGVTLDELRSEARSGAVTRAVVGRSLCFVAGFSIVFVLLGASATALGGLVADHMDLLRYLSGAVIIVFGLHFLGVFKIALFYREARFQTAPKTMTALGAFGLGLAFAFGWTPCVGPVLASVLFVAAGDTSVSHGITLLGAYAAGIGIPFILAAAISGKVLGMLQGARRYLGWIEKLVGALLVLTGVLFITGAINELGFWLLELAPQLGRAG